MAIIYYPKSQIMFRKDSASASYETLALAVSPNTILYFDPTGSGLSAVSASILEITSSWAYSASYLAGGQTKTVVLCSGFTPTEEGPDSVEIPMPYSSDGVTPVIWNFKRFNFRVGTSGSLSSSVTFEKSSTTSSFSASSLVMLTMPTFSYEIFTGSSETINSGEKLRFNVNYLGNTEKWTLTAEIVGA